MSTTPSASIETHPDIAALRAQYDEAGEQPASQMSEGLMLLAGLYAAASPWIVGFNGQASLRTSNLIAGIAVALLAAAYATTFGRTHGLAFVAPLLGVWLIVSPWVVNGVIRTAGMRWSNIIVGLVTLLLGAAVLGLGMRRPSSTNRRGTGQRSASHEGMHGQGTGRQGMGPY